MATKHPLEIQEFDDAGQPVHYPDPSHTIVKKQKPDQPTNLIDELLPPEDVEQDKQPRKETRGRKPSLNLPTKVPLPPFKNIQKQAEQEAVLSFVAEGMKVKDAFDLAGVGYKKLDFWKRTDQKFRDDLLAAHTSFKLKHVRNIDRHSEVDWKASKFLLERKFPEEYGEKVHQKVEQVGAKEDHFSARLIQQLMGGTTTPTQDQGQQMQQPPKPVIPISSPFDWSHGTDSHLEDFENAEYEEVEYDEIDGQGLDEFENENLSEDDDAEPKS